MTIKILIIDDSKAVHVFLKDCLKNKNIDFIDAFDGAEGIEKMSQNSNIDLVFLDWEMPKMTGPEVYDEFKKRNMQTPVIMLTSRNSVEDLTKMLTAGVNEYVMKPFTQDILLEKISFVLGKAI